MANTVSGSTQNAFLLLARRNRYRLTHYRTALFFLAGTTSIEPTRVGFFASENAVFRRLNENGICIGAPLGSGACPEDTNLPSYIHIATAVGSNDALNVIIDSFAQWQPHLRPEASKFFVVITDDDATDEPNNTAAAFTSNLIALDPDQHGGHDYDCPRRVGCRMRTQGGGWYYDDISAPTQILACPSTCAEMQDDAAGTIDVVHPDSARRREHRDRPAVRLQDKARRSEMRKSAEQSARTDAPACGTSLAAWEAGSTRVHKSDEVGWLPWLARHSSASARPW